MQTAVFVGQTPELAAFVSHLLRRLPDPPEVYLARNEIEGYILASDRHAQIVIMDDDLSLFGAEGFCELLANDRSTRRARKVLLTSEEPVVAAAACSLHRRDRVLAKPFRADGFREAIQPVPVARRTLRFLADWWNRQIRFRSDLDRYSRGQAAFAAAVLATLVFAAARLAAHGALPEAFGMQSILWGSVMLLVNLAGHLKNRDLRWETLGFAKLAILVSLIPPEAIGQTSATFA